MIPMEIRKFLGKGDSITIGAELSTLLSKGLIKSTAVKMGGSPFYYVRGQENKLELLNKYLNDKDKRVFEELRQEKVMKDSSQEPLTRVSLRSIPDFAKKVEFSDNGETVVYWRWHMVSEDEAISLIKGNIEKKDLSNQVSQQKESPVNSVSSESKPVVEKQDSQIKEPKREVEESKKIEEKPVKSVEEQKTISEEVPDFDDDFFQKIKSFLQENNIKIKKADLVRKGSDYELILEMKTPFGSAEYFCKAKSKKKCNEGDLSSAYLQGQNMRMQTIFLTTGEITKKAKQKVNSDYKGLLVKEL